MLWRIANAGRFTDVLDGHGAPEQFSRKTRMLVDVLSEDVEHTILMIRAAMLQRVELILHPSILRWGGRAIMQPVD